MMTFCDARRALLLFCLFVIAFTAKCPNETDTNERCQLLCKDNNKICYIDLDGFSDGKGRCCGKLDEFCTSTRLTSYHSKTLYGYLHKYNAGLKKTYYEDPVTKVACPRPYAYATHKVRKLLPVDFSETGKIPLKECATNSDCWDGEFCGSSVNPSFGENAVDNAGTRRPPRRFCYKADLGFSDNITVALVPEEPGLPFCKEHYDCKDSRQICFQISQGINVFNDQMERQPGICVMAKVCENPGGFTSDFGLLARLSSLPNYDYCSIPASCWSVTEYERAAYDPSCVRVLPSHKNFKLCCFAPKKCGNNGLVSIPVKQCVNSTECSTSGEQWCGESGYCCSDSNRENLLCPDKATPMFLEPACNSPDKKPGCICHRDRCCSGLTVDGSKVTLAVETYVTNVQCTDGIPPAPFVYAFCHNRTIVIVGRDVVKNKPTNYPSCTTSADCPGNRTSVCIRGVDGHQFCVPHPLSVAKIGNSSIVSSIDVEHGEEGDTDMSFIIIIAGVVIGVLLLIIILIIIYKKCLKSPPNRKKGLIQRIVESCSSKKDTQPMNTTQGLSRIEGDDSTSDASSIARNNENSQHV